MSAASLPAPHPRPLLVAVLIAVIAAVPACSRAPSEPAPAASTRGAISSEPLIGSPPVTAAAARPTLAAAPGRCVKATPEAAPPAVAAGPAPGCPNDARMRGPLSTVVTVAFPETMRDGQPLKVEAELATTPAETEHGLMYRTAMAEDHGMLFRLEKHVEHTFWMRNTCIPLDMFFVEDDGLIVGIAENVPTLNDDPRTVGCPSSWVLEVNAGWARRHGVRAGQKLAIPGAANR